jgi:hypothetical protein
VTKLSLLLKVLEGESDETLQLRLFDEARAERALPNLDANIKCGNSLIGSDYFDNQLLTDEDERRRVNPFDWAREFPDAMKAGGFDVIIGNPPYVRSQSLGATQREYYGTKYATATATYDIFVLFVEQATYLINSKGKIGLILPNKFFTTDYGEGVRKLLAEGHLIEKLVDFEDAQVFAKAGTYTTLLFLSHTRHQQPEYARLGHVFRDEGSAGLARVLASSEIVFDRLVLTEDGSRWTMAAGKSGDLLIRLQENYPTFRDLNPHVFQGLKTSADKIYMMRVDKIKGNLCQATNGLGQSVVLEYLALKPVVKGEDVQRYSIDAGNGLHILYPYKADPDGRSKIITRSEIIEKWPKAWAYLSDNKKTLGARDGGIWNERADWYAYARAQNIGTFLSPKFLIPYMTTRLRAAFDTEGTFFFVNITTGGYGLRIESNAHSHLYILGLLNSLLLDHCLGQMTNRFRGGYFAVNKQALERLPFRPIDFSDPTDKARHDRMVSLVQRMLDLHQQLQTVNSEASKQRLQRDIAATDEKIDARVYELYGLTAEEIRIVEGSA